MKVRPSVKVMCERCRVIKRHGAPRHLLQSAPQAEAGLARGRIAGVNLPNTKRLEIGLTYIYGIGQPTARQICRRPRLSQEHQGARPDREGGLEAP
jgi:ribosomal protein L36